MDSMIYMSEFVKYDLPSKCGRLPKLRIYALVVFSKFLSEAHASERADKMPFLKFISDQCKKPC